MASSIWGPYVQFRLHRSGHSRPLLTYRDLCGSAKEVHSMSGEAPRGSGVEARFAASIAVTGKGGGLDPVAMERPAKSLRRKIRVGNAKWRSFRTSSGPAPTSLRNCTCKKRGLKGPSGCGDGRLTVLSSGFQAASGAVTLVRVLAAQSSFSRDTGRFDGSGELAFATCTCGATIASGTTPSASLPNGQRNK